MMQTIKRTTRFLIYILLCSRSILIAEHIEHFDDGITLFKNIPEQHEGPRIALISFISKPACAHRSEEYFPYPEMVQFGTLSKRLYCQKHGYDYIIGSEKMEECNGIPAPNKDKLAILWMKVPMLARFIDQYDWVVWTDADSIFLNPSISFDAYINPQYDLLFGTHHMGMNQLCSGHIFVKNSQWSKDFLDEWWQYSEEFREGTWDLEMLTVMLATKTQEYKNHLFRIPVKQSDLSPEEFELGDFLVHFYSYHGKELYEIFKVFEQRYGYILENLAKKLGIDLQTLEPYPFKQKPLNQYVEKDFMLLSEKLLQQI